MFKIQIIINRLYAIRNCVFVVTIIERRPLHDKKIIFRLTVTIEKRILHTHIHSTLVLVISTLGVMQSYCVLQCVFVNYIGEFRRATMIYRLTHIQRESKTRIRASRERGASGLLFLFTSQREISAEPELCCVFGICDLDCSVAIKNQSFNILNIFMYFCYKRLFIVNV